MLSSEESRKDDERDVQKMRATAERQNVSIYSIQAELLAHERECLVRAEAVQRQLDSLFGRIRRVEALIMGSTVTLLLALVTILWKVF